MHRGARVLVEDLLIAVDPSTVFLRLDGHALMTQLTAGDVAVAVLIGRPVPRRINLGKRDTGGLGWVAEDVVEVALPFVDLGVQPGDRLTLSVLITDGSGQVVEQHPSQPLELDIPTRHLNAIHWRV